MTLDSVATWGQGSISSTLNAGKGNASADLIATDSTFSMQISLIWSLHYTADLRFHCQRVSELLGLHQAAKGWTGNYCHRDQTTSVHFQRERYQVETSRENKAVLPLEEEKIILCFCHCGGWRWTQQSLESHSFRNGCTKKFYLEDMQKALACPLQFTPS